MNGGSVTATSGAMTLKALYNATETGANNAPGTTPADNSVVALAKASSGGLVGISGATANAVDRGKADAYVASGSTLSATGGAVTLLATSYTAPKADAEGFAVGGVGVGATSATATASTSTRARLEGTVTGAGSIGATARANAAPAAAAEGLSGGILLAGTATQATGRSSRTAASLRHKLRSAART